MTRTKKEDETSHTSRLAEMMAEAMEERGVSIQALSDHLDITYEHARRMVRGQGNPSKYLLKAICEYLKIDFHEAEKATTADKIVSKFGSIPAELVGKPAGIDALESIWGKLTVEQHEDLLAMARRFIQRNRNVK